jgi:aspartate aminotransferase-like enzyme
LDLKKWLQIIESYENGGHLYHSTMPTDSLKVLRNNMKETQTIGFSATKASQIDLGKKVRSYLESKNFKSVSAEGFQAPGVVVSYTSDPEIQNSKKLLHLGMQIAAGVPLQCDERSDFKTFRLGLFGLEKLQNIDRTLNHLKDAFERI